MSWTPNQDETAVSAEPTLSGYQGVVVKVLGIGKWVAVGLYALLFPSAVAMGVVEDREAERKREWNRWYSARYSQSHGGG